MLDSVKKLKTLKDLYRRGIIWTGCIEGYPHRDVQRIVVVNPDELKNVAYEWISANQEKIDSFEVFLYDELVMKREYEAINKWIKYFFNLDEEA